MTITEMPGIAALSRRLAQLIPNAPRVTHPIAEIAYITPQPPLTQQEIIRGAAKRHDWFTRYGHRSDLYTIQSRDAHGQWRDYALRVRFNENGYVESARLVVNGGDWSSVPDALFDKCSPVLSMLSSF